MTTTVQRSFSGGEIAPEIHARTDQQKRAAGLERCRNAFVTRHAILQNRPGTSFVGEIKDSTKKAAIRRWRLNDDQAYNLEFGHQTMRVVRDGAYVTETAKSIEGVTQANPPVMQITGHGYSAGDHVHLAGILGTVELNGRTLKVANPGANTFELQDLNGVNIDGTAFGAYVSGGTAARIFTLATPYTEDEVADLYFGQENDVVTVTHENYDPRQLKRTGHAAWTLTTPTFAPTLAAPTNVANDGAAGSATEWVVTAFDSETGEESLQSSSTGTSAIPSEASPVTISWGAVAGATEYNIYKKSNGIWGFIGSAQGATPTFKDVGIPANTAETPPSARNPFSGASDKPAVVALHQQRQIFANTKNKPDRGWASQSGNYLNFTKSAPLRDSDAVDFRVPGRYAHAVKHMVPLDRLLVLTTGGVFTLDGGPDGILRPGEVNPTQHSYDGADRLVPQIVGRSVIFVQAGSTIVRDLSYEFEIDGYRGNDLTVFAAHLFEGYTITDWAYQEIPNSILWLVRSDGKLISLTYVREHQLWAWSRHDTDGTVESLNAVPEKDAGGIVETALYLLVKRTVNGVTRQYVERMKTRRMDKIEDAVFVDCSLTYDGRHTGATTMALSGGTNWTFDETLTLTASVSTFASGDVGKQVDRKSVV